MRVGEMPGAVAAAMGQELPAGGHIQTHETPVAVETHDGRDATDGLRCGGTLIREATLPLTSVWAAGPARLTRSRGPREFLAGFHRILQSGRYAARQAVGRPQVLEAACPPARRGGSFSRRRG